MEEDLEHLYIEVNSIVEVFDVYINYADDIESSCLFFLADSLKAKMEQIEKIYTKQ